MKVRICDICKKPMNEERPAIISIDQYVENEEVPKEKRVFDLCDLCSDLFVFAFDNSANIKAMLHSVKLRKTRLEKPKTPS